MKYPSGFRRKANGKLEYRFTHNKVRYSLICDNVPDGLRQGRELIEELEKNGYIKNKNIMLEDYHAEFFEIWRQSVKPATVAAFKGIAQKYLEVFGKHKIREIEAREVQMFYDDLLDEKGIAVSTARGIIRQFSGVLKEAVKDGIIQVNPCERVRFRKNDKPKATETIHRALTVQEQKDFEKAIEGCWHENLLLFMLYSGVRVGEASGLMWQDVDFKDGVIHIRRTITYSENYKIMLGENTKSASGVRDLPMTKKLRKILMAQKERDLAIGIIDDVVFLSRRDGLVRHDSVDKEIKNAITKMPGKVERFTSHCLRDTYATRFLEAGGDLKTLQAILGHSTFAMTSDLYAHVLPNTKLDKMERMEKMMEGEGT